MDTPLELTTNNNQSSALKDLWNHILQKKFKSKDLQKHSYLLQNNKTLRQ